MIMKKTLLLLVVLLATVVTVNAQTIKERLPEEPQTAQEKLAERTATTTPEQQFLNLKYVDLLNKQNDLLNERIIALSLMLGGSFLTSISASLINSGYSDGLTSTVYIFSAVTALVGSTWMIVNEFQLIGNRKKINKNLTLRYGLDGVALQF